MTMQLSHLLEFVPRYSIFISRKPSWKYAANIDGTETDVTAEHIYSCQNTFKPMPNLSS